MRMSLTPPAAELPADLLDIELSEDYESLAMDACQLLSDTDALFVVSGFGQEEWPVSISYDLSSVIEQLPVAIDALRSGLLAEIDLYGQGIEPDLRTRGGRDGDPMHLGHGMASGSRPGGPVTCGSTGASHRSGP
ncbi:hypothetical protein AW27_033385 [Streptomyces sp. PCS3-D2]|uniref:hypothetical protein n=1 Tax=Streptomyces sp. PCS3-D2 TaxID=1460244 RepID=UPI00044682F5|nr:hypothetical protein [Streptomyces sp. PCS3-D2]WKV76510.1 hypothetical protein AW27_033385 [Streptomyces sp. PCS3-D2]